MKMENFKNKARAIFDRTKDLGAKGKSFVSEKIHKLKNKSTETVTHTGANESKIKKSQIAIAIGVAVVVILIFVFLLKGELFPNKVNKTHTLAKATEPVSKKFDTIDDHIKPEEAWRYKMDKNRKHTAKEVADLKGAVDALVKNSQNRKTSDMDLMQRRLFALESKVAQSRGTIPTKVDENKPIEKIELNFNAPDKKKIDTVDTVIPAGAFAKAILLSGIDAPTSLSASSDPLAVLIRVTDSGTLPRRFKSDLKDCHVIAGGFGELSSERVYLRLDRLTCTERATGEIIETDIAGFVTGEDGKSGMRGRVVEKASKYLANSAIGGLIGGLSSTLAPQDGAVPYISLTAPKAPSITDKFQRGFAGGMSSSMDRLSQYYIDRAESLQPVIEVSPGRIIDIIFTAKSEIGATRVKQELAKKRDSRRREIARNIAENDRYK